MSEFSDAYAVCPFYVTTSAKYKRISCEGVTKDCYTTLSFKNRPSAREKYKKRFCDADYKSCRIYRMLMEKYTEK